MITRTVASVIEFCLARARLVVVAGLIVAVGCGIYAAGNFRLNSDINALLPSNVEWRKQELSFERAFQRFDLFEVVVQAPTPELATAATNEVTQDIDSDKARFRSATDLSGSSFFARHSLLYLSVEELKRTVEGLIEGEPIIHDLATDRSLRGLVAGLEDALLGLQSNRLKLDDFARPLNLVSDSLTDVLAAKPSSFSWRGLVEGKQPSLSERLGFIEVHPILDFHALEPGEQAEQAVRRMAAPIAPKYQASVRLTGPVAIDDEQFGTIRQNAVRNGIVTAAIVLLILWLALRSSRLIAALVVNLAIGLAATAALGLFMVGAFNIISIYFAVLFVGIGVDFAIQFSVRYRDERHRLGDLRGALTSGGARVATPLALASLATAAGFFSFLPTDYKGVSELGLIAGAGMLIAFLSTVTILPALIFLSNAPGEPEPLGYRFLAPVDEYLARHRIPIIVGTALVVACALPSLLWLKFDSNPIDLQNPKSEAIATYRELERDPSIGVNAAEALAPSLDQANAVASRLRKLPQVLSARTLSSFIPGNQEQKIPLIRTAAEKLAGAFDAKEAQAPPTDAENVGALEEGAQRLTETAGEQTGPGAAAARRLSTLLSKLAQAAPEVRAKATQTLVWPLDADLQALQASLMAQPVTQDTLPRGLIDNWVAADGRARISIEPKGNADELEGYGRVCARGPGHRTGRDRRANRDPQSGRHDPVGLHRGGCVGPRLDRNIVVFGAWAGRRRVAHACAVGACGARDDGDHVAHRHVVQFRQHHRAAIAARRRRRVQDLLHHGVAGGDDAPSPDAVDPRGDLQRADDGDRLRQPVVFEPPRHLEHGQAAGAVARLHFGGRCPVPAYPDGKAARRRPALKDLFDNGDPLCPFGALF